MSKSLPPFPGVYLFVSTRLTVANRQLAIRTIWTQSFAKSGHSALAFKCFTKWH